MSVDTAIARFRRRQADMFFDTARVTRATGEEPTFDEDTGEYTHAAPEEIYEGPCLIRASAWQARDVTTGEREIRFRTGKVKFPVDTPILKDDLVTCLTSRFDQGLVDAVFRVTDVPLDGLQIARVGLLEQTTGVEAES